MGAATGSEDGKTSQSGEPIMSRPTSIKDTEPEQEVQYPPAQPPTFDGGATQFPPRQPPTFENGPALYPEQSPAQSRSLSGGVAQYPQYHPMQPPALGGGSGQHQGQEHPMQTPTFGGGSAPYSQSQMVHIGEPWKTRLFDCQENSSNAVMTAILPCVTFGQIAEILDGGETTCPLGSFLYLLMMPALCSAWILGSTYRTKLRKKFNLVQAPYEDWASHVFCPCCSLCQEFRELQLRNLDPALGWNGILAQQAMQQRHQEQVMYPPQKQSMF